MKVYCLICKKWFEVNDKSMPCLECGLRMCGLEGIADKFPDYEAETAREVSRWMNTPPGAITEGINKIVDGIAGRVGIVVPQIVTGEITKQVTTLLEFLQDLSCYTIILDEKALYKKLEELFGEGHIAEALAKVITLASGQGVLQQANKLGYQVGTVNDLRGLSLIEVDKLVSHDMGFYGSTGLAALEGFFTGLGEFALLVMDIVAITAINFRYIQRIATCFGYNQDLPQEKIVTMRVFMAAFGGDFSPESELPAKIAAAYELKSLAYALRKKWTEAQMAERGRLMAILTWLKKIAPQRLAKQVTSRKAAALVPIVGAGIGATISYMMTSDTGKAGWYYYRYRKLLEDFGGLEGEEMPPMPSQLTSNESSLL